MKAILFLLVVGFVGSMIYSKWEREAIRRQMIAEHRIGFGMTHDQVEQAVGKPVSKSTDRFGREIWRYAGGVTVDFSDGKMIGSHEPPAPVTATAPAPNAPDTRVWTQLADGRWVQHDRRVSAMQSIGGGGNFRDSSADTAPKATPRTMLDQPAHR